MKIVFSLLILITILIFQSCENGVVLNFTPDRIGEISFIKSEKLASNGELNCNYADQSHKHNQRDSYYLYFILKSDNDSPINPYNPKFSKIKNTFSVELLKRVDKDGNIVYEKDNDIVVSDLEYLKFDNNLKEKQNFNFLIDLARYESCFDNDKNNCSLSGGFDDIKSLKGTMINELENYYFNFGNEDANFMEDECMGVKTYALSVMPDETANSYTYKLLGADVYLVDLASIKARFKKYEEEEDNALYHRKLFDDYIAIADKIKNEDDENKNIVVFTSGYDEGFYDTENVLNPQNKSSHTESDFLNALNSDDKVQVFIAPENRKDLKSFPDNEKSEKIDNGFYEIACKTNGAYFPFVYKAEWKKVNIKNDIQIVLKKIKYASYGMWRVKVTINNNNTDRYYDGKIVIKAKDARGEEIDDIKDDFRIVR